MVNYGGENTQFATPGILAQNGATQVRFSTEMSGLSGIVTMLTSNGVIITSLILVTSQNKLTKTHSSMD